MALNSALAHGRKFEEAIGQLQGEATTGAHANRRIDLREAINNAEIHPLRQHHEGLEPPSTAARHPLHSSWLFEELYDRLGRSTGRYGSRQAQKEVLDGWIQTKERGAYWLVRQVVKERNLEALDGASLALEAMSDKALPYIIETLNASATSGDAETALKLFRILEWFPAEDIIGLAPVLATIVEQSACQSDVELREAAYRCIPLLPNSETLRTRALAVETDPELRELLQHERDRNRGMKPGHVDTPRKRAMLDGPRSE
jgi:hypothetical protein